MKIMNKLSADEIEYQQYLAREKYLMDEISKKKYAEYKMNKIAEELKSKKQELKSTSDELKSTSDELKSTSDELKSVEEQLILEKNKSKLAIKKMLATGMDKESISQFLDVDIALINEVDLE